MRASELIRKLQEIMEDYHCDPDIRVEVSQERWGKREIHIKHEPILDAEFKRGYHAFDKVILMQKKDHPKIREIIR